MISPFHFISLLWLLISASYSFIHYSCVRNSAHCQLISSCQEYNYIDTTGIKKDSDKLAPVLLDFNSSGNEEILRYKKRNFLLEKAIHSLTFRIGYLERERSEKLVTDSQRVNRLEEEINRLSIELLSEQMEAYKYRLRSIVLEKSLQVLRDKLDLRDEVTPEQSYGTISHPELSASAINDGYRGCVDDKISSLQDRILSVPSNQTDLLPTVVNLLDSLLESQSIKKDIQEQNSVFKGQQEIFRMISSEHQLQKTSLDSKPVEYKLSSNRYHKSPTLNPAGETRTDIHRRNREIFCALIAASIALTISTVPTFRLLVRMAIVSAYPMHLFRFIRQCFKM